MAEVKVQKVQVDNSKVTSRELYATVCYFYPQYKLHEVAELPARDVSLLLKVAEKQEAAKYYNLTLIAQAPHSKKQANVRKLLDLFKKKAR